MPSPGEIRMWDSAKAETETELAIDDKAINERYARGGGCQWKLALKPRLITRRR